MNFFPCKNLSRKHYSLQESSNEFFSLQESFKETVFLARIFQGNSIPSKNLTRKFIPCKILARCLAEKCIILQDLERKSCKILARNAFFSTRVSPIRIFYFFKKQPRKNLDSHLCNIGTKSMINLPIFGFGAHGPYSFSLSERKKEKERKKCGLTSRHLMGEGTRRLLSSVVSIISMPRGRFSLIFSALLCCMWYLSRDLAKNGTSRQRKNIFKFSELD